jgi:hypothetical protein
MSQMRPVGPKSAAHVATPAGSKPRELESLATALRDAGITSRELFGWQKTAYRRVEATSATHVSLDFDGRAVALPKGLLPRVEVDQWVRFDRHADRVAASVDLRATLRAESRLSDLFQVLVRP